MGYEDCVVYSSCKLEREVAAAGAASRSTELSRPKTGESTPVAGAAATAAAAGAAGGAVHAERQRQQEKLQDDLQQVQHTNEELQQELLLADARCSEREIRLQETEKRLGSSCRRLLLPSGRAAAAEK